MPVCPSLEGSPAIAAAKQDRNGDRGVSSQAGSDPPQKSTIALSRRCYSFDPAQNAHSPQAFTPRWRGYQPTDSHSDSDDDWDIERDEARFEMHQRQTKKSQGFSVADACIMSCRIWTASALQSNGRKCSDRSNTFIPDDHFTVGLNCHFRQDCIETWKGGWNVPNVET